MLRKRKILFFHLWLACFFCLKAIAQPVQLPSLFGESNSENESFKNSVLQPGETPESKIKSLVFIKTSVSKRNCFVGEPISVTYQLYTAIQCHSKVINQIAFNGCSVIEMTTEEPDQTVKEKGKIYRVQLIRRVQLIPLQGGDLLIPSVTVNNEVSFYTLNNLYSQKSYSADVSSEPYTVEVTELPEKQPEGFSGITGKFSIQAKTDSSVIAAGENNRLQVTISGAGNIEAITEPTIKWPKHTEHFDPIDSQHINRLNFPESGNKTFIFPFISTKKGKLSIPEISFTYFNTELKKFETVTTKVIPLVITASVKRANPIDSVTEDLSNQKYLWFVPAIAFVVIAVWLMTNKNSKKQAATNQPIIKEEKKETTITEEQPIRPDYNLLLQALNEAENNTAFFTNAKTLLISALQFRLSPKQNDEMILLNLLQSKNEMLAKEARQIIAICNQSIYSPVEDEALRSGIVERLSDFINQVDNS